MTTEDVVPDPSASDRAIPDVQAEDPLAIERWNQQAWPPITFGVPAGWTDVPPERFAWLPLERRIPPTAPILQQSHILAAVERAGADGQVSQLQLRLSDNTPLVKYIVDDPLRWSGARSLIGKLAGDPEQMRVCDYPAVLVRYECSLDGAAFISTKLGWTTRQGQKSEPSWLTT